MSAVDPVCICPADNTAGEHPFTTIMREAREATDEQLLEQWWWLSFSNEETGKAEGVAIVQAPGPVSAVAVCWKLGCNPGGEVLAFAIPAGEVPAPEHRDRLIPAAEADAIGGVVL